MVAVPTSLLPMRQETVLASLSPSISLKPDQEHVRVSAANAVVGLMDAATMVGAVF